MPSLATSWETNDDQSVWTFTMRGDVPWVRYNTESGAVEPVMDADGNPRMVTAGDIVYTVQRTCDAETASDYAYVLYIVQGCQAANTSEGAVADIGVEALDDTTVQFTLEYGASFFGQIASMWITRPTPSWDIEEFGDVWTEPGNMSTNGPFVMSEWIHNDSLQLVRNPDWYGWEEMAGIVGNIDVIDFTMIEEDSTEFAMYENNELDYSDIPLEMMDSALSGEFGDSYVNTPRNCTYYYGFITEKEAVSDVNVRHALSMAVDRETLTENIMKGGEIPANAFTNPLNFGSPAGDPDIAPWALSEEAGGTGYAAALEMAKELMAEAGYPDGKDSRSRSVTTSARPMPRLPRRFRPCGREPSRAFRLILKLRSGAFIWTLWIPTLRLRTSLTSSGWRGARTIPTPTTGSTRSSIPKPALTAF